jgi:hypothetical protein
MEETEKVEDEGRIFYRRIISMMLILQVVRLIGIFRADISLTLTKIKFTIHKDQGQVSEFDPPPYD